MNLLRTILWISNSFFFINGMTAQSNKQEQNLQKCPARVLKSTFQREGSVQVTLQLLKQNPNFIPGNDDPKHAFLIPKSEKGQPIVVSIHSKTQYYECSNNDATVKAAIQKPLTSMKLQQKDKNQPVTYYFDIKGRSVTNLYQICLP
jgi:hypothetical protein